MGRSDAGWEISVLPMDLTPKGKELFKQDTLVMLCDLIKMLFLLTK